MWSTNSIQSNEKNLSNNFSMFFSWYSHPGGPWVSLASKFLLLASPASMHGFSCVSCFAYSLLLCNSSFKIVIIIVHMCVWLICVGALPKFACRGQEQLCTLGCLLPSSHRFQGWDSGHWAFVANIFTHRAVYPAGLLSFLLYQPPPKYNLLEPGKDFTVNVTFFF